MSKMTLSLVASTIVLLFLAIIFFDGAQSRQITGDDMETMNPFGADFFILARISKTK